MRDAVVSGSIAGAAVTAAAALCGARTGSAVAPINATSHVIWGIDAADATEIDVKHTLPGAVINLGAGMFWATLYERAFGRAAERGDVAQALLGGGAIAGLAYVVDYHLISKRLTPGWEAHLPDRSLAVVFGVLALALPVRGLMRRLAA